MPLKPKVWRELVVFGWRIPVFRIPTLEDGAYGYYEDESKYIAVDNGLKGDILTHTLVHEMFHACLDRLHVQPQLDDALVEVVVEGLTTALMENFKVRVKEAV